MASPIAHSLAGALIYFTANRQQPIRWPELFAVIIAANLADFDLIPGILLGEHSMFHRTFSHSLFTALAVATAGYFIWRRFEPGQALRVSFLIGLALVSQLLIDWLSYDPTVPQGIAVFWPFSHEYYMANKTLFLNIERDNVTTLPVIKHNMKAAAIELLVMGGPFLWALWRFRHR